MYGLGVIMYIMLCGYPPFEPENGIVDLEFPEEEWGNISPTVKDLISSLLDHDPEKRPSAQEVLKNTWICGESAKKEELRDTISTMKIFNLSRISDSISSMRAAKANKKEAVWSIFSSGYAKLSRPAPKPVPKPKGEPKKNKKKSKNASPSIQSPRPYNPDRKLQSSNSFRIPELPPIMTNIPAEGSKPSDELNLAPVNQSTRDPDELHHTIALLESKLVSLSNINCALQSQIDEISGSFNKLKFERDDLLEQLDQALVEIESLKQKKKKDKK